MCQYYSAPHSHLAFSMLNFCHLFISLLWHFSLYFQIVFFFGSAFLFSSHFSLQRSACELIFNFFFNPFKKKNIKYLLPCCHSSLPLFYIVLCKNGSVRISLHFMKIQLSWILHNQCFHAILSWHAGSLQVILSRLKSICLLFLLNYYQVSVYHILGDKLSCNLRIFSSFQSPSPI